MTNSILESIKVANKEIKFKKKQSYQLYIAI